MSTVLGRNSPARDGRVDAPSGQARAVVAGAAQRRDPLRRRWGRMAGGVLATIVGAWLFASLYLSADDRRDVLALANPVERFDVVERADLRVVRLPPDSDLAWVPATRLDEVAGRVAATDLTAGSLLAEGQLVDPGERLVLESEAVVGVLVGPGDAPSTGLVRGAAVSVVVRPAAGTAGASVEIVEIAGWVAEVSSATSSSGDRPVAVVVASGEAAMVSAAAADRRVTLVVAGG